MSGTWTERRSDVRPWLELVGRFGRIDVGPLLKKLETDDTFVETIEALLKIGPKDATPKSPWQSFEVIREHCILELLTLDESTPCSPSTTVVHREPTAFDVPSWALDELFSAEAKRTLHVRQFYDCLQMGGSHGMGYGTPFRGMGSVRMFGNSNIGMELLSNLQVSGQLAFDGPVLLTSWWITTLDSWEDAERVFARSCLTLTVGDTPVASTLALPLWRSRQPILTRVHERQHMSVTFNSYAELSDPNVAMPVWVFLEGWLSRRRW